MKKYLLIISLFVSQLLMAGPVTQEQALQKASDFMTAKKGSTGAMRRAPLTLRSMTATSADAPLYVFNIDGGGYVIVSGDDRTYDVLGYSTTGQLDERTMPANLREVLQQYADIIGRIRIENLPNSTASAAPRRATRAAIAPLLKSEWNQGLPYCASTPQSNACDPYDGYHCVTGCVATAMAQLMYYHKWPAQTTTEIPAYTSKGDVGAFNMPAIPAHTPIDWNAMQDTYQTDYTGTAAENAVANLMKYCGTSVQMGYGTSSSAPTAWVPDMLVKYFDYEESTARYIDRVNYSYDEWQDIIYQELQAKRPVLFSGQSSSGGHAFLCDGYDSDDLYHINWGWGGASNGNFRLNVLYPREQGAGGSSSNLGYCLGNSIGIGIQPNDGTVTPKEPLMTAAGITLSGNQRDFTRSNSSQAFTDIKILFTTWNRTDAAHTFDLGARIIDSKGNMKAEFTSLSNSKFDPKYGLRDRVLDITVSNTLPDGDYRIILTSRVSGSGAMKPSYNSDGIYLPFTISGNTLHFHHAALEVLSHTFSGKGKVGSPQTLSVTIRNTGDAFRSDVYYYVNRNPENAKDYEAYQGAAFLDLKKGEQTTISFDVYFKNSGTNTVSLQATNGGIDLGTFSTTIAGAAKPVFSTVSVANYDAEKKVVNSRTFDITLRLTNEGEATYDESVQVSLLNNDNGTYYFMPNTTTSLDGLDIAPGASIEKRFVFDNLSVKTSYCLYIEYWLNGDKQTYWGDVYYLDAPDAQLELADGSSNETIIEKYSYDAASETSFVGGKDCNMSLNIVNTGDADFNGYVWAYVLAYSSVHDSWFCLYDRLGGTQMNIPAGETTTFTASFSDTEIQKRYGSYGLNKFQVNVRYGDAIDNNYDAFNELYTSPEFQFGDPEPVFTVTSVANANANGDIVDSSFDITVQVENKGKAPYKQRLYTIVEYYNGNDIWPDYNTQSVWNINLPSGATDSKQFTYSKTKQYNSYRVRVYTADNEEVYSTPFYKVVASTPQPYLNMATRIENGTYNSEDNKNHVVGSIVNYTVSVENLGDAPCSAVTINADLLVYNRERGLYSYQRKDYPTQTIEDVNLDANQYFDTSLVWTGLEVGQVYAVYFTYTLNGSNKQQFGSSFTVDASDVKGDANNDCRVDVGDVVSIAYKVMDKEVSGFNTANADVNGDGVVNVADVIAVTNIINSTPAEAPRLATEAPRLVKVQPQATGGSRQLMPLPTKAQMAPLTIETRTYEPTFAPKRKQQRSKR